MTSESSDSNVLHFVANHGWLYLTLHPEKIAPGIVVATQSARLHASDPQVQVLRCSSFSIPEINDHALLLKSRKHVLRTFRG